MALDACAQSRMNGGTNIALAIQRAGQLLREADAAAAESAAQLAETVGAPAAAATDPDCVQGARRPPHCSTARCCIPRRHSHLYLLLRQPQSNSLHISCCSLRFAPAILTPAQQLAHTSAVVPLRRGQPCTSHSR